MTRSATRVEQLAFGIAGVSLGTIDRRIAADDPPPLAPNAELAVIGRSVARVGARAMVTGAARYTVDVRLPGMLFARILRSPHAHARVASVGTTAAERYAGVRAVHVVTEGSRRGAGSAAGRKFPLALYAGAPVAAVAATTRAIADEAIRLIEVAYEVLPFVVDMDEARKPGAPLVLESDSRSQTGHRDLTGQVASNLLGPMTSSFYGGPRGNVDQGFGEADVIVEDRFRTQVQTHCCLEPHAIVAD